MDDSQAYKEGAADFRQQNKIIKIVESGDLDVLNKPLAAVSADERESFIGKIRGGAINAATLDDKVVKNIGAPFSGTDGVQKLRTQIEGDPRLRQDFGGALRSSLYRGGRYRDDLPLADEDVQRFVAKYPTPLAFDAYFIGDRIQAMEEEIRNATPSRGELLHTALSVQRQLERTVYPRLKAALYGKRNEYWEQCKHLLKATEQK